MFTRRGSGFLPLELRLCPREINTPVQDLQVPGAEDFPAQYEARQKTITLAWQYLVGGEWSHGIL